MAFEFSENLPEEPAVHRKCKETFTDNSIFKV